ncbi:GerAB/ArcD/ProY family transporter [Shouchella shacheensis]|uniref:GerAB/ArcD/ProY family transporter n=1 Tax=Shouchella shacheensis TaxID=1649580 RepID=UPI00073FD54D|nr:endospore germination permease [Shouchella shacheensis]
MEFPRQLSVYQATAILISTIIGVGVLPLPLFAVRAADTGAPLVTFIGIMVAFFGLAVVTKLGMRFPEKSIIGYSEDVLGKWLGRIGSLVLIAFFAVLTGLAAREFGQVVITTILPETPLEISVIVMLLLASVSSRNDINTFAYIHVFYLPALIAPVLIIIILSLGNASNSLYLQPLWGNDPSGMITGGLTVAALLQGSFIITMIIPFMRFPQKAMKATIWGVITAGGVYVLIVAATLAMFGPEELKNLLWPSLELARATSLPGEFLQRLDVIFLVVWVTAVYTTIYASYMFTAHSLSQLFRLRDHKMFSFCILPLIFIIAMIPQNTLHMYEIVQMVGRLGLILTILYPILLYVIALLRKKKGRKRSE